MESMTGYSYIEYTTDQFTFVVEVKSLNSKYLEIYTNLPKILKSEDEKINKMLKENFIRGKVEFSIDIVDWHKPRPLNIDKKLLHNYHKELNELIKNLKLPYTVTLDTLLHMDGVLQRQKTVLSNKTKKDIMKVTKQAIDQAKRIRKIEGRSIEKDLKTSLSEIEKCCKEVKKYSKEISKVLYEKFKKNIEQITNGKIDENRIYTEIAILADKQDINEELTRLQDHIKKFKDIMKKQTQIGRQLDFLAQEMFREINTIGAKSNVVKISHNVVNMKNYIDKIREQCRNIV